LFSISIRINTNKKIIITLIYVYDINIYQLIDILLKTLYEIYYHFLNWLN